MQQKKIQKISCKKNSDTRNNICRAGLIQSELQEDKKREGEVEEKEDEIRIGGGDGKPRV